MRDNDDRPEKLLKPLPRHPAGPAQLMEPEPYFDFYIQESEEYRKAHGISKAEGKFVITDLSRIQKLPEWKKTKLRHLVRGGSAPASPDPVL